MQALCCCFKSSRATSTTCLNRVCLQKMHFILRSVKELQLKSFFIWVLHEFRETSCEVSPTLQSRNFMLTQIAADKFAAKGLQMPWRLKWMQDQWTISTSFWSESQRDFPFEHWRKPSMFDQCWLLTDCSQLKWTKPCHRISTIFFASDLPAPRGRGGAVELPAKTKGCQAGIHYLQHAGAKRGNSMELGCWSHRYQWYQWYQWRWEWNQRS